MTKIEMMHGCILTPDGLERERDEVRAMKFPPSATVEQPKSLEDVAERLAAAAQRAYTTHAERSAMRCALGDAAALCDALAEQTEKTFRVRGNRISKQGQDLAMAVRRCGNAIWEMRDRIKHPTSS